MRLIKRIVVVGAGLLVLAAVGVLMAVRASLPQLDGERTIAGLDAPVQILRDAEGVVTIRAHNRRDAALASGFVHAEERFFQMDLMRRLAAGELAELVGAAAADFDAEQRRHRMRQVARRVVESASDFERAIVDAYTAGVNAGLEALAVRPFDYLLLGAPPASWQAEDTVLVVLAMYFRLQDARDAREARLGRLHDTLPRAMFDFLTQTGTSWDAPIDGEAPQPLPVPGPEVCDVRRVEQVPMAAAPPRASEPFAVPAMAGSNAFALGPRRTRDGVAILANDMHLKLAVPNTWFRMRLRVEGDAHPEDAVDVTGVSLPGTPAIVAGSNGYVAWGFTNTYGDWVDRVVLDIEPGAPHRYRTASGYRDFEDHTEVVRIRGARPRSVHVEDTVWGPVIGTDAKGRPVALHWLAQEPEATNLGLLAMEHARTVEQAMDVANHSGIPPQNVIVADRDGGIGWTVMGRIPLRRGYDPRLPGSWAEAGRGWLGWLPAEDYPRITNPPSAALWSANSRPLGGAALALIGDGGFALGARAAQIRDALLALEGATEADMLAIQLDDRALFLARWRSLLLGVLDGESTRGEARRLALKRVVMNGARRAAVDDAGYRLVREFRRQVARRVWATITSGCGAPPGEDSPSGMRQFEGALWRILEERPRHLLDPRYHDWRALLLAAADAAAGECPDSELAACTWGAINVLYMRHPMSRAIPILSAWLDMKAIPLPGDTRMPRVQTRAMGASERFVVSPGHEERGYFQMPGGQSGHPLSPYYDAGHLDWVEGKPSPFLPGAERHRLVLVPAR